MRMDRCAGRLRGIVAGIRQMRRSGLQLGRGCLGTDARLRGDHDAVCTLPALCHCRYCGRLRQSANLHQDEYEGRGNYP